MIKTSPSSLNARYYFITVGIILLFIVLNGELNRWFLADLLNGMLEQMESEMIGPEYIEQTRKDFEQMAGFRPMEVLFTLSSHACAAIVLFLLFKTSLRDFLKVGFSALSGLVLTWLMSSRIDDEMEVYVFVDQTLFTILIACSVYLFVQKTPFATAVAIFISFIISRYSIMLFPDLFNTMQTQVMKEIVFILTFGLFAVAIYYWSKKIKPDLKQQPEL